jgi:hypothetical protein
MVVSEKLAVVQSALVEISVEDRINHQIRSDQIRSDQRVKAGAGAGAGVRSTPFEELSMVLGCLNKFSSPNHHFIINSNNMQ